MHDPYNQKYGHCEIQKRAQKNKLNQWIEQKERRKSQSCSKEKCLCGWRKFTVHAAFIQCGPRGPGVGLQPQQEVQIDLPLAPAFLQSTISLRLFQVLRPVSRNPCLGSEK
jgi:hypothetical protein